MTAARGSPEAEIVTHLAAWHRDRVAWAAACIKITNKRGQLVPLVANLAQRRVYAEEQRQRRTRGFVRTFVLKGRQGGVSTWEQGSNLHQIWSEPGTNSMTLAHTGDDTARLFGVTQLALDHFPRAFRPPLGPRESREVSFPTLRSKFWTGTAGAARTGRSVTLKRVHLSEFAMYDDPLRTLTAFEGALVPEGSILTAETTATGYDSEAHRLWQAAAAGHNDFVPLFIPWWECDVDHYRLPLVEPDELGRLEEDERDLVDRHGLALEQIAWRRQKMRAVGRSAFLTEFAEDAESCWAAAGGAFYDVDLLKHLLPRASRPASVEMGGALELFTPHPEGEPVVIGCDTAEGVGQDRSTFVARTRYGRALLATFADNRIEPRQLAGLLNTWGRRWASGGHPAFLVIERNMHGSTVLRCLRDEHRYPVEALYHRPKLDTAHNLSSADLLGWVTSATSKGLLLDAGRDLLHHAAHGRAQVPSAAALRDAFGVRKDPKTGRADLNGKDLLVAEMLCEIGAAAPDRRGFWTESALASVRTAKAHARLLVALRRAVVPLGLTEPAEALVAEMTPAEHRELVALLDEPGDFVDHVRRWMDTETEDEATMDDETEEAA